MILWSRACQFISDCRNVNMNMIHVVQCMTFELENVNTEITRKNSK